MPSAARWRRLRATAIAFLISVAFLAGDHYWDLHQGRKEFDRALARYKAAGGPADPAAWRPSPPSGKNGVDGYLKALHLEPSDFGKLRPEVEAWNFKQGATTLEIDRNPSEADWKDIDDRVRKDAPRLALLVQASSSSEVVYPLHYEKGWATTIPHLNPLLEAGGLMCWDVRLRRREGTTEGMWERIDAIFAMADSLAAEPLIVSQWIRLSLVEIGLTSLEEALGSAAPPAPWNERLERRLDPDRLREGMRRCSLHEMAMKHEAIVRFLRGEATGTALDHDFTGVHKWYSMPELLEDGAKALDRLARIRAALDLPAGPAILKAEAVQQESEKDPGFTLASYPRNWRALAEVSARMILAREAIRIRAQVASPGNAPNSVGELVKDPLFGRPFKYLRTNHGFMLEISATSEELKSPWGLQEPPRWRCPRP